MDKVNLVSVIIPVYKVEDYIVRCLKSVINQAYENIEIIMVDDRGGDNSLDVARNYLDSEGVPYKYAVNEKNSGPSFSRNEGLKLAEGKYVFFLDADDCMDRYCISHLVSVMESDEYDCEIVMSDHTKFTQESEIQSFPDDIAVRKLDFRYEIEFVKKHGYVWGVLYSLDVIKKNNLQMPVDIRYMEDNIWNVDYLECVDINKAYFVESAKYHYFLNPKSLSRPGKREIIVQKTLDCLNYYENRFYGMDSNTDKSRISEMIETKRYFRNCFFDELHTIDGRMKCMQPEKHKGSVSFNLRKIAASDLSLLNKISEAVSLVPVFERIVYKIKFTVFGS